MRLLMSPRCKTAAVVAGLKVLCSRSLTASLWSRCSLPCSNLRNCRSVSGLVSMMAEGLVPKRSLHCWEVSLKSCRPPYAGLVVAMSFSLVQVTPSDKYAAKAFRPRPEAPMAWSQVLQAM